MDPFIRITVFAVLVVPAFFLALFVLVAFFRLLTSPSTLGAIFSDLSAIRERDPAAEGWVACICYPGWWALAIHRLVAHPLYSWHLRTLARLFNFIARFLTGTDIHPGATFGRGIFIDHAHGVVIGETAIVGNNVTMLHQVTLGGTGKQTGKRHPTIDEGVLLGVGCKVLGNIVVGKNSKIGAGSVVVHAVPPDSTVVGVPGKVVASGGTRVPAQQLDQTSLPDPLVEKLLEFQEQLRSLNEKMRQDKGGANPRVEKMSDVLAKIVEDKHEEVASTKISEPLDTLRGRQTLRGEPRSLCATVHSAKTAPL